VIVQSLIQVFFDELINDAITKDKYIKFGGPVNVDEFWDLSKFKSQLLVWF
jgi:hypothetical protein